jgi:four helix bundle protein
MQKNENKIYNLEERTAKFAENIVKLCLKIPKNAVTIPLIDQLLRAGTSQAANYCEANGASSKKDFKNKIFICKKEAKETKLWLNLLKIASPENQVECQYLWQEAQELTLIFSKIAYNTKV